MSAGGIREGLRLLRRANFAKLFTAYLITHTGSAMAPIAIAFGVLELTGSTRTAAYVVAAPVAAMIIIVLVGGTLADRSSRQRIMVRADLVSAVAQAVIATLFISGEATVPLLILLMLINGSAVAFHAPASIGFIPQAVAAHELQAANSLLGAARSTATTIGAALAGVLVATVGAGMTLAIDAVSFALAAWLIGSLRVTAQVKPEAATVLKDLRLGWREFVRHQWLWTIVLQFAVIVAGIEAVFSLIGPATARDALDGPRDWGFIMACFGAGTIVGGLVSLRLRIQRPMWVASWLVFLWAPLPLALSIPLPVSLIALTALVNGIAAQMFAVLWNTTLHTQIPPHLLSRVSAYDHLGSIALAPLGVVAAGILYEVIGGPATLWLIALIIIVPTALVLLVPGVRHLRAIHPTVDPQIEL